MVAGVVPAAGDVEPVRLGPAGVEPLGLWPSPRGNGGVPGVGRDTEVARRPAVPRRPRVVDRASGALQVKEPKSVAGNRRTAGP